MSNQLCLIARICSKSSRCSEKSCEAYRGRLYAARKICGTGEKVILSVEDDHAAYVLLQLGFNEVGGDFRLYRVEDGAQALDFLRRSGDYATAPKPNLILLNLNLPRVTGFDVLEAMQADPELGEVPAVVFSSSRMD